MPMAGEIERYISPSITLDVKPAQSIQYHEKLMSSKHTLNIMEDYLVNEIDENALLGLLQAENDKSKALQYLDQHLQENNGILIFQNKSGLFKGFALALGDSNQKVSTHCTKIVSKIIPQLGSELDKQMSRILSLIIGNVGHSSVTLQKESIQTLHVYMKHSLDVFQILHAIAHDGIQHSNARIRQQIIRSFPTLLFPEFKDEDFFDIVHSLTVNLTESLVDPNVTLMILEKVSDFIGKETFTSHISRLSLPLRHTYNKLQATKDVNKLIDAKAPNRIAIHSKHSETEKDLDSSLKFSSALLDGVGNERHVSNFSKSGHFDTVPTRRHRPGNMYSSLSTMPNYDPPNTGSDDISFQNEQSRYKELSFIPKHIIEQLSSSDNSVRLQAVETLKDILCTLRDPAIVKENMVPLLSLLQPMFDDKNFRVACVALRAFSVMISCIGPNLNSCLKLFIFAVSRKLGNVKDSVRSECYRVLLQVMDIVGRQKVLNLLWDKLAHKQYKVREDFICVVIATLLDSLKSKNSQNDLDFDIICRQITPLLTDNQQVVRKAALDCIAVLGHILGSTSKQLLSAVDSVELKFDNASGVMPAVHARLLRKQLPRLTENMLVEYAVFSPSSTSMTSPHGADIQWILAAEKPKKAGTPKGFYGAQDKDQGYSYRDDSKRSVQSTSAASETSVQHQPARRHMSAGKHRKFPWTIQEDLTNSKHPSSAPVMGIKNVVKKQPPFRPRNTWGPESEIPAQFPPTVSVLASKPKSGPGYDTSNDSGGSYQEIYKRRKEAHANRPSVSSTSSSKTDSGYKPSFGSNDFSASSSSTQSSAVNASSALSSSCPSTFFENNTTPRPNPRRVQKKASPHIDDASLSSAYASEESTSPFSSMKPALARSASKRRDNVIAHSRDLLKTDDLSDKIPMKLKNTSASPRFDRLVSNNTTVDQMRPMLKASHNSALPTHEKFPGPSLNNDLDLTTADSLLSSSGYTPSTLQRKFKESMRNEQSNKVSSLFDKENSKHDHLVNGSNVNSKAKPSARPIVPSNFSPARHRSYEDVSEFQSNAVSSIRRSAQNKRERMRSQPGSDDGLNGSFNEFSSELPIAKTSTSSVISIQNDSFPTTITTSQPTANNDTTLATTPTDAPSFKYSPNAGVTFDSKKADTDVSVVGVRYPSQLYPGSQPSNNAESRVSPSSPVSSTSTTSITHSVIPSIKNLPTQAGYDRHRSHRGSSLGMASTTASPDSASTSFNVQGKGVFMTSSASSLISASEVNDVSSSSSKEEVPSSKHSLNENKDSNKFFDGVCGVAVRQPSLTPEDIPFQSRRSSDYTTEVSLSASLRERKERQKEVLTKKAHNPPKSRYYDLESVSPTYNRDTVYETRTKLNKTTSPLRVSGSSHRSAYDRDSGIGSLGTKSASGTPVNALLPLDNPEKSLGEAIASLEVADSVDWAVVTQGMYTIRRLATHHPNTLTNRFHDVITLLTKHVSSLRSQVSKASVQAVNDLYTHLRKPLVDSDIDATVKALLSEYGKPNSFIKNETNKTLQTMVASATCSKILNALLNTGLRHKNKDIRGTTAQFCAELVNKMGPGKSLSGVKDTTDKLLEAVSVFINDRPPTVRYYGRYIINELMVHEDFNRCLDRYLSAESSQEVKAAASSIKERGLGSLSSVGSRKALRKRNESSTSSTAVNTSDRFSTSSSTSAHARRKGAGTKMFSEQEQEDLKNLCTDLTGGNISERKSAIMLLLNKLHHDRRFVEDNIVKLMGAYVSLLSTAQTKINHIGLESLPDLIVELHPCLRDTAPQLVPALLKLASSKQHSELALKNIDFLLDYVEHSWIIQPFATSAMYGTPKTKQIAIANLIKLIDRVARKKVQIIDRHVLPVLWNLYSNSTPGGVQLRKEMVQLTLSLYGVYGQKLLEYAEANNHSSKVKEILSSQDA